MISIITPNYNYGRFLDSCIQSVINQTYTDWELLICDDGSTDNSAEIVRKYAQIDSRIKFLTGPHSGGPASPRNRGIRASSGELIAFLDADDMLTKDSLQRRVEALEFNRLDFVCGQTVSVGETTTLEQAYSLNATPTIYSFCRMPTVMVKRSLLESTGLFDERLLRYEEKELFIRLLLAPGKVVRKAVLPETVAYYRTHDQNITHEKALNRESPEYQHVYDTYVKVVSEYYPNFPFDKVKSTLHPLLRKTKWCIPKSPTQ